MLIIIWLHNVIIILSTLRVLRTSCILVLIPQTLLETIMIRNDFPRRVLVYVFVFFVVDRFFTHN